jgi:hypothetical protein
VLYPVARLLHLASVIICLIVVASFALFAVNQTNSASTHQQQVLNESSGSNTGTGASSSTSSHSSTIREALDEASSALTSPFSEVFASSNSEWAKRGVRLLLALAVYGFGLGYLGRMIRMRV